MLTDNERKELQQYFEKIAVVRNKDVKVIEDAFEQCLAQIEELEISAKQPRYRILKRAKSGLTTILNKTQPKGEEFVVVTFGRQSVKDWNRDKIRYIELEISRGNLRGMIEMGKVMTMINEKGKRVPVSKIIATEKVQRYVVNGKITDDEKGEPIIEYNVLEGVEWDHHGTPLLRDSEIYVNGNINRWYSRELQHSYDSKIVGIGFPVGHKDQTRLITIHAKYNMGDVDNDGYFFKKYKPFVVYSGFFEVGKYSTDFMFDLYSNSLTLGADEWEEYEEDPEYFIEQLFTDLDGLFGDKLGQWDYLPQYLDGFSEIKEYHEFTCIKENGKVSKTTSGYDRTKFGAYAIMAVDVSSITETGGYVCIDSMVNHATTIWPRNIFTQPKSIPGRCLMMISTYSDGKAYNRELRKKVKSDTPDISIQVHGIISIDANDTEPIEIKGLDE